ncbi:MAG: serine/threonine-protein kinase [Planctomycetota bacterium]
MSSPHNEAIYHRGDVIGGRFEVQGILGKGVFGIVYLVYDRELRGAYAMKTFSGEFAGAEKARGMFEREAALWSGLAEHPFVLAARFAGEINGRPFLTTDYIAPDIVGRVKLSQHIAQRTIDADRALTWTIQFCHGMEHTRAHGIECHRDIKPANVFITEDGMVKIADFGLALAAEDAGEFSPENEEEEMRTGRRVTGSAGYAAPEVFEKGRASVRSDIYSFGVVLWQMVTAQQPFGLEPGDDLDAYVDELEKRQLAGDVPPVDAPFWPQIKCCLDPDLEKRYSDFGELRGELENLIRERTGEVPGVPDSDCFAISSLSNKASGLMRIGRHGEAIECHDKVLEMAPACVSAWFKKGVALSEMGKAEDAFACYDKTLALDPSHSEAWNSKGVLLMRLNRFPEALECLDKSIEADPSRAWVWSNKGNLLSRLERYEEALVCYDKALEVDANYIAVWFNMGLAQERLGRGKDAAQSYRKLIGLCAPEHRMLADRARQRLNSLAFMGIY